MTRRRILVAFMVLFAVAAAAADFGPTHVYFATGTASGTQTDITWGTTAEGYSRGVCIKNDSSSVSLWFYAGTGGTVNTTTGAGGGEIKPGETFNSDNLSVQGVSVATAASTAAYRVWAQY